MYSVACAIYAKLNDFSIWRMETNYSANIIRNITLYDDDFSLLMAAHENESLPGYNLFN